MYVCVCVCVFVCVCASHHTVGWYLIFERERVRERERESQRVRERVRERQRESERAVLHKIELKYCQKYIFTRSAALPLLTHF